MPDFDLCVLWAPFINEAYVKIGIGDRVEIVERDPAGAGKAALVVDGAYVHIKAHPSSYQIKWIKNLKCADGSVVVFKDDQVVLHIAELKSRVSPSEWAKVHEQFIGMYLNSLALMGLMDLGKPSEVHCYLAFKRESVSEQETAAAFLVKKLPGMPSKAAMPSWSIEHLDLPNGVRASLSKVVRDRNGDASLN